MEEEAVYDEGELEDEVEDFNEVAQHEVEQLDSDD